MFKVIHEHDSMTPEQFTNALELAKDQIIAAATKDVPSKLNKDGKEEKNQTVGADEEGRKCKEKPS